LKGLKLARDTMTDRVRKPEKYDSLLKLLKDEEKVFSSYKDIIVFATCLAKSRGQIREQFSKSSEPIPIHVFNGEFDIAVMNSIAITEPDECEVHFLSDDNHDRKVLIFEEYAAAGLKIISEEVLGRGKSILDSFVELLADEEADSSVIDDISSLTL